MILSVPFCPNHVVRYHFVPYNFVLEPRIQPSPLSKHHPLATHSTAPLHASTILAQTAPACMHAAQHPIQQHLKLTSRNLIRQVHNKCRSLIGWSLSL